MCGRFELHSPISRIMVVFNVKMADLELLPRYNIAPTQDVPVVMNEGGENRLAMAHWGLIPRWAKDPAIGNRMINARAESLNERPAFKGLLAGHRCIVVADGFYEWRREGKRRIPMYVTLRERRPFGFAGLYSYWRDPGGQEVLSCTIVTTASNELVGRAHDRMPVILAQKDEAAWLDPETKSPEAVLKLLGPCPAGEMEMYEVTAQVNKPANDSPENIKRVG
jgi:putative SOS response-associated peptidase YedK